MTLCLSALVNLLHNQSIYANIYFWRTYEQQEIDLIEERGGRLHGYEMKWSTNKPAAAPPLWREAYPNSSFELATPDTYQELILP